MSSETSNQSSKFLFDNDFFDLSSQSAFGSKQQDIIKEAEERGFAAGVEAGKNQAESALRQEFNVQLNQIQQHLEQLDRTRKEQIKTIGREALSLLKVMLNKVLGHATQNYAEEILKESLETMLQEIEKSTHITVKINPQALAFVEKFVGEGNISAESIKIVGEAKIAPGDCLIEWENSGVDIRLQAMAERMEKILSGAQITAPDELATAAEEQTEQLEPATEETIEETVEAEPTPEQGEEEKGT